VVGVFIVGANAVAAVSRFAPSLSLVVALATFMAQVAVAMLLYVRLSGSSALTDGTLAAEWLAAGLIACTVVWVVAQIVAVRTERIPIFDLPEGGAR
jgi:ATP synthase protein I